MNTKQHPTPSRPALRRAVHLLLLALTLLVGLGGAHAATGTPPDKMTYQGFLADSAGVPLGSPNPVNYVIVFRIWSADSGGSNVWSEVQTVTIDKGSFSVVLGDGLKFAAEPNGSLSAVFNSGTASDRYLEITVTLGGNPVTIAPRLRLVAAPYALLATTATRLVNPDGSTLLDSPSTGAVNINGAVNATSFTGDGTGLTGVLKVGGSADFGTVNASNIVAGNFSVTNKFTAAKIYSSGAMGVGITNVTRGILEVGGVGMLPFQFTNSSVLGYTNVVPLGISKLDGQNRQTNYFVTNNVSGNLFGQTLTNWAGSGTSGWRADGFSSNGIAGLDLGAMMTAIYSQNFSSLLSVAGIRGVAMLGNDFNNPNPSGTLFNNFNSVGFLIGSVPQFGNTPVASGVVQLGAIGATNILPGFNNLGNGFATIYNGFSFSPALPVVPGNFNSGNFAFIQPQAPTTLNYQNQGGFNGSGFPSAASYAQPTYFSIFADGPVAATTFYALSDARIKKVGGRSDGSADLTTLMDIEVTDYTYKDELQKGAGKHKKVIAQQVEKIYPQAVSKSTGPVPDIYQQASVKNGWVYLATDLKTGEKVRLTSEKGDTVHEVLEVRGGSFRVDLPASVEGVFVYGREVNDFRSVDYEALAMLNVSATQELVRQQRELARQVEALRKSEARIAELEQKTSQMGALERKVADLEKLLSQVVAGRSGAPAAVEAPAAKSGNNQ